MPSIFISCTWIFSCRWLVYVMQLLFSFRQLRLLYSLPTMITFLSYSLPSMKLPASFFFFFFSFFSLLKRRTKSPWPLFFLSLCPSCIIHFYIFSFLFSSLLLYSPFSRSARRYTRGHTSGWTEMLRLAGYIYIGIKIQCWLIYVLVRASSECYIILVLFF